MQLNLTQCMKEFVCYQELQHAQRIDRLRDEQLQIRQRTQLKIETKFDPCVVCGDKASGIYNE